MPKNVLGFVEKNSSAYWRRLNAGVRDAGLAYDVETLVVAPDEEDVDGQRALAWQLLERGVDGLGLVATEAGAFDDVIAAAVDAGVAVVTFDLDAPTSRRHLYVGLGDYVALGRSAGAEMAARLSPGDRVVVLPGSDVGQGAIQKVDGFCAVLEEAGIECARTSVDNHDEEVAHRIAREALATGRVDGLFGPYAYHPGALARAVADAAPAHRPVVVGFDMNEATVTGLRRGEVAASIWIREYYFGLYACAALATLTRLGVGPGLELLHQSRTEHAGNRLLLEPQTYTAANVEEFDAWLRTIGDPTVATTGRD